MVSKQTKNVLVYGGGLILILSLAGVINLGDFAQDISNRLQFGTQDIPEGPVGDNVAQIWRITTKDALSGADLTVDSVDATVNGIEIGNPGLNAGYVEYTATPIRTGDVVAYQVVEAGYYTIVNTFTVPTLEGLQGGQTYYTVGAVQQYQDTTTDPTLSATYGGTDIDVSTWDISASTEYTGIKLTLDVSMAAMDDLCFGPKPYRELVGDKDYMSKYFHVDANDSDVIIKDVSLEGTPLTMIWTDSTSGSDFQSIYEFDQMLINDGDVSGDGLYDFTITIVFSADQTHSIVFNVYDLVDGENAAMGAPGTADETVTIVTS